MTTLLPWYHFLFRSPDVPGEWCAVNRSDPNAYRERGGSVVQDAVSGKMSLSKTHFDNFHTYGCWWSPSSSPGAKDGFIRFYMDDVPWYEIGELVLQVRRCEQVWAGVGRRASGCQGDSINGFANL